MDFSVIPSYRVHDVKLVQVCGRYQHYSSLHCCVRAIERSTFSEHRYKCFVANAPCNALYLILLLRTLRGARTKQRFTPTSPGRPCNPYAARDPSNRPPTQHDLSSPNLHPAYVLPRISRRCCRLPQALHPRSLSPPPRTLRVSAYVLSQSGSDGCLCPIQQSRCPRTSLKLVTFTSIQNKIKIITAL